jgi:hypothetical protein
MIVKNIGGKSHFKCKIDAATKIKVTKIVKGKNIVG